MSSKPVILLKSLSAVISGISKKDEVAAIMLSGSLLPNVLLILISSVLTTGLILTILHSDKKN